MITLFPIRKALQLFLLNFVILLAGNSACAQDSSSLTKNSIIGLWKLQQLRISNDPNLTSEDPEKNGKFRTRYPGIYWLIDNELIYEMEYPCCVKEKYNYNLKENQVLLTNVDTSGRNTGEYRRLFIVRFFNDSLILQRTRQTGLNDSSKVQDDSEVIIINYPFHFPNNSYHFSKVDNTDKMANKIKKGWINPECLYGKWEIPTGEVSVPFDAVVIDYPWDMPDTVEITKNNFTQFYKNGKLYINVDGVKKPFEISSLSSKAGDCILKPTEWFSEYETKYYHRRAATVWMRKLKNN